MARRRKRNRAKARRIPFEPKRTTVIERIRRIRRRLARVRREPGQIPRAAGRRIQQAGAGLRRRWETSRVVGGPVPTTTTGTRTRKAQATTNSRPARPAGRTHTMAPTTTGRPASRRLAVPEAEALRRAGIALGDMEPVSAADAFGQLAEIGYALIAVGAGLLDHAETLAGQGADPRRIVNAELDEATRISETGTGMLRLAREFRKLYHGQIEQEEESPARPMHFPKARAA